VTKSQYIESLTASPWRFPEADGIADVPSDWAAAAWDVDAVRSPLIDELQRGVSKLGALWLDEKQLAKMSEVLRTGQVVALYEALTNDSPHRESEFRGDFVRLFAKHASQLPPELTRDQIIERLGVDEATAAGLLGEE
jgi:hypothetical protein